MKIQASVICHVGCVRSNNEDNYYLQGQIRQNVEQLSSRAEFDGGEDRILFAVADGMGGEAQGEFASLVAVKSLCPCAFEQIRMEAARSIAQANALICQEISQIGRRMGTTLAALYLDAGKAVVCNVGDSRVYLLRSGSLTQLSTDHSQVQQLVDLGILTREEARHHKGRHALTQHLGILEHEMIIQPAFSQSLELKDGDTFLLCSDGLTDMVEDETIHSILSFGTPESQVQELIGKALAAGGRDNVTVLVATVSEQEACNG